MTAFCACFAVNVHYSLNPRAACISFDEGGECNHTRFDTPGLTLLGNKTTRPPCCVRIDIVVEGVRAAEMEIVALVCPLT